MFYILSKSMELDRRDKHKKHKNYVNRTASIFPELNASFKKDCVKLGNTVYEFNNVISMNNNYEIILTEKQTEDKVVNLFPLLSVGLAELISRYKLQHEDIKNKELLATLKAINGTLGKCDTEKFINTSLIIKLSGFNLKKMNDKINHELCVNQKTESLNITTNDFTSEPIFFNIKDDMTFKNEGLTSHLLICMNQIRQTSPNEFSPYIKELVTALNTLCIIDTKSYIQLLFDWFLMLSPIVFFVPEYKNNFIMESLHEQASKDNLILMNFAKTLRITNGIKIQKEDTTEYTITDTTSLGINMLLLFYANLMKKCSTISNDKEMIDNVDFAIEYYTKVIKESLKNDFVGRYYKFKPTNFNICIDDVISFDLRGENYNNNIPKYRYEDKQILQKMYNIPILNGYIPDIIYCSIKNLAKFMGETLINMDIVSNDYFEEKLKKKTEKIIKSKTKEFEEFKQDYKNTIEQKLKTELKTECINEIEELNSKIKYLENQINNKNTIIDSLYKECEELTNNIENFYSDYTDEEMIIKQKEFDITTCLNLINSFKIIFAGRKDNFAKLLEDNGFTNFIHFEDINNIPSTPPKCDFICFNTKYMSHSLVNTIKSIYKDKEIIVFHGMNIKSLIYVCYDFLSKH